MEFTINSRQKKVELLYESAEEQAAIMEFISKWLTYKEENIKHQPTYRNDEITWASNSTSHGMCDILPKYSLADINVTGSIIDTGDNSNTITINTTNLATSNKSTSEDLPSNCIHVSAKSK